MKGTNDMAHAIAIPPDQVISHAPAAASPAKVTPGKVAMWLFLATEIMFFTGLIGSYIVLRAGSPPTAYGAQYAPQTDLKLMSDPDVVRFSSWPRPFDTAMNPLDVTLTAINTFFLMSSSVTLSLAMSYLVRGLRGKFLFYLVSTLALGSLFLGIQVYEYYNLIFHHYFPIGVSASGHFTPDVSLFASCFFTMTGFHGAHVMGGVVLLAIYTLYAFMGYFTPTHHAALEYAGLYWHFVDLVWIVLFTVVYLI